MGIAERREREREQRRQEILDAAEQVFFSQGLHSATMDQVAECAELSKGTLYLYFRNKEDLLSGVCLRGLTRLKELFEKAVSGTQSGLDQVKAIGQTYFRFAADYPDYFSLMIYTVTLLDQVEELPHLEQCREMGTTLHGITASAIDTGKADGSFSTRHSSREIAVLLWGMTTGVIQIAHQGREKNRKRFDVDPDTLTETYFDLIVAVLS
ncbi:TetR/AcrR family transcriptional regulator [candidate division KSB1 bacterium]|nr:TetR/AcrR family transcriptional regulator [candidate division KSB1 bacterium]